MIFKDLKVLELASGVGWTKCGPVFCELGAEVNQSRSLKTQGMSPAPGKISRKKEGDLSAYFCRSMGEEVPCH